MANDIPVSQRLPENERFIILYLTQFYGENRQGNFREWPEYVLG
jgi:hypothetical protein